MSCLSPRTALPLSALRAPGFGPTGLAYTVPHILNHGYAHVLYENINFRRKFRNCSTTTVFICNTPMHMPNWVNRVESLRKSNSSILQDLLRFVTALHCTICITVQKALRLRQVAHIILNVTLTVRTAFSDSRHNAFVLECLHHNNYATLQ